MMTTMMIALMTMTRVVSCNPSGNDSAQLIWESGQLISPPADCQLSYSTFCCFEQNYKKKYKNQTSIHLQITCDRKNSCLILISSSPDLLSRALLMTIQRVQKSLKSSRLRKIVYCKKRGGVCF